MSDTIRYRSVPGSNDYLSKRLAREDSIANHTFAHCYTRVDAARNSFPRARAYAL